MLTVEMLSSQEGRKKLVQYIESRDNLGRKVESFKQSEIYKDRIGTYVLESLRTQFSEQTVTEMPLVKSVNIAKRCVNNQSVIYSNAPEREWLNVSDDQKDILWSVYHEMNVNKKLGTANKFYKLHKQCLGQVIPKDGKLIMRVLQPHQWDVITDPGDPEKAIAYIVSSFDKTESFQDNLKRSPTGNFSLSEQNNRNYRENLDMQERERQNGKTYLVWTLTENFIMNKKGEVIGEVLPNPINELPFFEISEQKDFEYWIRQASAYGDFTVEFNAALTETRQTVKMQSFAVAIVKAPKEMQFSNLQIGPNYILHLPNDELNGVKTEFEFASPTANIDGAIRFLEVMLSGFLTSEGIDPKTVSMSGETTQFTSGIDRLLSLIDKMQASRDDYDVFQYAETQVFKLVKAWLNALNGNASLDSIYHTSLPSDCDLTVKYKMPEMVQTELDKIELLQKKIEIGLASPITGLMELEDLTRKQAEELYTTIQKDNALEAQILPG
jgi:hypothetical protein